MKNIITLKLEIKVVGIFSGLKSLKFGSDGLFM
jgi:hypothetical protein